MAMTWLVAEKLLVWILCLFFSFSISFFGMCLTICPSTTILYALEIPCFYPLACRREKGSLGSLFLSSLKDFFGIALKNFLFFLFETWQTVFLMYIKRHIGNADVAEWQTRCVQVAVRVRGWRFKSFRRHQYFLPFNLLFHSWSAPSLCNILVSSMVFPINCNSFTLEICLFDDLCHKLQFFYTRNFG